MHYFVILLELLCYLLLLLSAEVQQSGYCLKMPKPLFSDLIIEKWLVVNHSFPQNQYLKLCN